MQKFEDIKTLLDNSSIYYLIAVSMDSTYNYVNSRYRSIFDGMHGNLIGQHYSVTIHPDDLHICNTVSSQCFSDPENVYPAVIRKHDGKGGFIITQWEYKAMFDQDGQPVGMFCIGHDITEFMQASFDLKSANESLIKTQLSLAQITYIQSHWVRKPIANIMGLTMLLETMEMDPAIRGIFDRIDESAKELDEAIRKMSISTK